MSGIDDGKEIMSVIGARCWLKTPLGLLELVSREGTLLDEIHLPGEMSRKRPVDRGNEPVLRQACQQLTEYFSGDRLEFDLPLRPQGTPFQQKVWRALQEIPFGATASYREIATAVGQPTACRAVGGANGRNPLPIVIPCHRVIGANGALVGFSAGLDHKSWLLRHEAQVLGRS